MPNLILVPVERMGLSCIGAAALRVCDFPCTIGRSSLCDLQLSDGMISRCHCRIDVRNDEFVVQDLDSRNGTAVNGKEITEPRVLADGDFLQLGRLFFAVRMRAGPSSGMPRRVLVVEDDADAAETMAVLLRCWGHDVQVAGDADQALEAARSCPPDAVLLDLNLGDGPDGLEVAHRLRNEVGLHDARVLAVTGQPLEQAADEGGDLDGVLVKPVDALALRQALASAN
jgi:CheY-like chemotaxis protein